MPVGRNFSDELFGQKKDDQAPTVAGAGKSYADELFGAKSPAESEPEQGRIGSAIYGGAKAFADAVQGPAQTVLHGANWLYGKLSEPGEKRGPAGQGLQNMSDNFDRHIAEQEAEYQRGTKGSISAGAGRAVGSVAPYVAGGLGRAAAAIPSLGAKMLSGAVTGAAQGAIAPVYNQDYATEKAMQVGLGGAMGGAVPLMSSALARVVSPNASKNANLQLLKSEGVTPTVGQALGGRWNATEEKLTSLPIMGDAISLARKRAMDTFNTAAINRASNKVGVEVQGAGQPAVQDAGNAISQSYNDALGKITGVQFDGQFNRDLMQLRGMAQNLVPSMKAKFNKTVNDLVLGRTSRAGSMLPETYKSVDSELGNLASKYGKSQVASEGELGDAVAQLQALLKQQMMRSNPHVADELKAADTGWANLVRVEGAAKAAKNAEGVFTPAQLNGAVQAADDSVRKRAVARGTALMQDLGNAGQQVIGNKIPNSFSADRAMLGIGSVGAGMYSTLIPAGLAAGAAAYTPLVQRLAVDAVSRRPNSAAAIAEAIRKANYDAAFSQGGLMSYAGMQEK